MMNDTELARKMRRVPSINLPALRGVIAFLEVTREDPKKPVADELAELSLIAQRTAEAGAALTRLGWYGEREFIAAYPGGENIWDAFRQLAAIGGAAIAAHQALERACRSGRPVSNLTHAVQLLAELIERGGGKVDATQGGELCQVFGVVVEAAGLSVANQRETVRAALKKRGAKQ